jgi:hypothetical protein
MSAEVSPVLAICLLVVVSVSEIRGLIKKFRCFTGKPDLIAIGAIRCSVIGMWF